MSEFDPRTSPWSIDEAEFYEIDDWHAQRQFLLRYAVLAPSGHNTQPWTFRIAENGIEVYADYTRRLKVADPGDRELLISIGAAILNLRVAAAHFGFETTVLHEPPGNDLTPVAVVTLRETCNADEQLRRLFPAIIRRRTTRGAFETRDIEPEALDVVCEAVEASDDLHFIVPHDRQHTAELVEQADRQLMRDARWRAELAEWIRPNESSIGDGLPADAFGIPGPLSAMAPHMVRTFDVGAARGKQDRSFTERAAGLVVITGGDDPVALVRTGETLERFVLTLAAHDIQYAFLNQVCQVPALRTELWNLIRTPRPPQLLLRFGYGQSFRKSMPRRPVDAVTV